MHDSKRGRLISRARTLPFSLSLDKSLGLDEGLGWPCLFYLTLFVLRWGTRTPLMPDVGDGAFHYAVGRMEIGSEFDWSWAPDGPAVYSFTVELFHG